MKYTIYKNEVGQLMAMEGHCDFDGVVAKVIDHETAEFQEMIDDSERLAWLIDYNFVVTSGINSFWVSEIEGQYRIGPKCSTPEDAIDKCKKIYP